MNLINKETFTSKDVQFKEVVFPLNTSQSNPYMHPLPPSMPAATRNAYCDNVFSTEPSEA